MTLSRLISGGQTGVDRGALEAAIQRGFPHGGWCPLGRRAEDGPIPSRFELQETATKAYGERTAQNVRIADGTLILKRGPLTGGTAFTCKLAREYGRPLLVVDLGCHPDPGPVADWIRRQAIKVLNVAGPRESGAPGIQHQAQQFVAALLSALDSSGEEDLAR